MNFKLKLYKLASALMLMGALVSYFAGAISAGDAETAGNQSVAPKNAAVEEVPGYETQNIEGWTLRIKQELRKTNETELTAALELLRQQLQGISKDVPKDAVTELKKITLWFSPPYFKVGERAEYHPGAQWLIAQRRNPLMVKGVEFTNISIFQKEVDRMPLLVLHELAHGYHDQVLSFNNKDIIDLYNKAKESGKYDKVERWNGNGRKNTFEKAYAMTTPQEYFAECTEAFFGRNDFYPFTREELHRHDPLMEALLEQVWKNPQKK